MHTTTLLSSMHLPPAKHNFLIASKGPFDLGKSASASRKEKGPVLYQMQFIGSLSLSPFVAGNGKIAQLIFLAAHFGFFVKLVARDASGGGAEEAVFI